MLNYYSYYDKEQAMERLEEYTKYMLQQAREAQQRELCITIFVVLSIILFGLVGWYLIKTKKSSSKEEG